MQREGVSLRKPKTCLILDSFVCFVFSKFQRQISETEAWQAERKKAALCAPRVPVLVAASWQLRKTLQCHATKDEATQRTGTLVFWLLVLAFLSQGSIYVLVANVREPYVSIMHSRNGRKATLESHFPQIR